MKFNLGGIEYSVTNANYKTVLETFGKTISDTHMPIINSISEYDGEYYTAVTLNYQHYPILCKVEDNLLVPFAAV